MQYSINHCLGGRAVQLDLLKLQMSGTAAVVQPPDGDSLVSKLKGNIFFLSM